MALFFSINNHCVCCRCVLAVIRHGDRTPKQKMKMEVMHPKFFEVFKKYDGQKFGHVKLKKPQQLQEILDISRELLETLSSGNSESEMIEEKKSKLVQIKTVLEMYGHFSGINRKVQLKYQPKGRPRNSSSEDNVPREASLLLILKWGGELTPSGRRQAEELGKVFRCMYPGGQGNSTNDCRSIETPPDNFPWFSFSIFFYHLLRALCFIQFFNSHCVITFDIE